ncbi:MAG: hypothetical protein KJN79_09375 [Gammaproteobacteria bacterium]|nr:hypothetical protein [Gammaproteobacteria bacterium]
MTRVTERAKRIPQILDALAEVKPQLPVTVTWIARRLRMGGQRNTIAGDVREMEKQGLVSTEPIIDAMVEPGTNIVHAQKILIVRRAVKR